MSIKKGVLNGVAMGLVFLPLSVAYGTCFWYGSKLVFDGDLSPGTVVTVSGRCQAGCVFFLGGKGGDTP